MKVWQVVDVNGDVVFDGLTCEDEAETYVERSHLAGVAVVERDTVKEVAEEMLVMLKALEWCAEVDDSHGGYNEGCPQCSGTKPGSGDKEYEGHWDGCLLKGVIKKAEGRR